MQWLMEEIVTVLARFHMPLFFLLSGMTFAMAYCKKLDSFERSRMYRQLINLLWIYLVFSLLWSIMKLELPGYFRSYDTVTWTDIYNVLWSYLPMCHLWYLHALLLMYLLASVKMVREILRWKIGFLLIGFMFVVVSMYLPDDFNRTIKTTLEYIIFFLVGMFYWYFKEHMLFSLKSSLLFFALSTVLFASPIEQNAVVRAVIAFGWILIAFYLFRKYPKLSLSSLTYLGGKSLDIYIWHFFLVATITDGLLKITEKNSCTILILGTLLCVTLSLVLSFILQKIGVYDYLFHPLPKKVYK